MGDEWFDHYLEGHACLGDQFDCCWGPVAGHHHHHHHYTASPERLVQSAYGWKNNQRENVFFSNAWSVLYFCFTFFSTLRRYISKAKLPTKRRLLCQPQTRTHFRYWSRLARLDWYRELLDYLNNSLCLRSPCASTYITSLLNHHPVK